MDIYESLRLIAATGCGIQIGGFLLLSLFHQALFKDWPQNTETSELFKRFYRFNTLISILSGIIAILGEARSAGFLLAILGMSYSLLLTHLLPAIRHQSQQMSAKTEVTLKRSPQQITLILVRTQTAVHFSQLCSLIYLVYMLSQ
ncbi:MAG: hypothetical protein OEY36_11645 [Gammaproteobacteria bacterium]|nr:hypothetical protein [Gammaproteobacteria bacterium]